jgi:hypothetical protein
MGGPEMWRKWLARIFGERKVKPAEVLRCFLEFEARRPRDDETRRITHGVPDASYEDLLRIGSELDRHYKQEYEEEHPVLQWTCDEHRVEATRIWVRRRRTPIDQLFICGLDEAMLPDLQQDHGNLAQFAERHLHKYPSLDPKKGRVVEPDIAMAVEQTGPGGTIQLLAGAHRVFGLINDGTHTVDMYLAIQRHDSRFLHTDPTICHTALEHSWDRV